MLDPCASFAEQRVQQVETDPSSKMKSTITVLTAALLLAACNSGKSTNESSQGFAGAVDAVAPAALKTKAPMRRVATTSVALSSAPDAPASDQITTAGAAEVSPSMLIRTGNASIEVDKLNPAIAKVRQMAAQLGGYIANSSITGGRDQIRSATLEVKIPAAKYDQAIGSLGGIGKVESVNTSVEDVGEEYVDVTARVTNAKRLEERLVNLLATRTGKLEDVLAVERELARVREEIERYEGRLRYLRTRVAVSTLSVTVHEPVPILGQNPGDNPIVAAFKQAWRNFVGFVAWFISSLGILIPVAVVAAATWYAFRRIRRRRA